MEKELKIEVVKTQVSKAFNIAQDLKIKTDADLKEATNILTKIKTVYKLVKERMDSPVKLAYAAYKNIKAEQEKTFGEMIEKCETAESLVKNAMVEYQENLEAEARKKEAEIAKKLNENKISEAKAEKALEKLPEIKTEVVSSKGQAQFRTVKEVEIFDESLLPRQYLIPNTSLINKDAKSGIEIPGVKVVEKKTVAGFSA